MADLAAERLEREEFEVWAIERNIALTLSEGTVDELAATNRAWHTWKAAWQAARRAPAEAGVPEGWRLVPVEPTQEMIRAAYERDHDGTTNLY